MGKDDNKKMVEDITSMDVDFAQWYTDIVRKAELVEFEQRQAQGAAINNGEVDPKVVESRKDESKMKKVEVRESIEYGKAFLKGIKTGDYKEARTLLSGNASSDGQIPVPTFLETEIKNAWEEYQIAGLVKKEMTCKEIIESIMTQAQGIMGK